MPDAARVITPRGTTALQELKDQLDLLDSKLDDIVDDLQRQDLDRLLANRRFLEERFGSPRPAETSDRDAHANGAAEPLEPMDFSSRVW